ncbi:hypothetical protein BGZ83_004424 [Gryganskiella cystojenkinii]|nr:hypothetical protein BGZ83_004424 [Gryganskiella cystojenkinii]
MSQSLSTNRTSAADVAAATVGIESMSFNDYFDLSSLDTPAEHLAMQSALISDISSNSTTNSSRSSSPSKAVSPFEDFDHASYLVASVVGNMDGLAQDDAHHQAAFVGHADHHQHTGNHNNNTTSNNHSNINNINNNNIGNKNTRTSNSNKSLGFYNNPDADRPPVNIVSNNNNTFGLNMGDFDFLDGLSNPYKFDLPEGIWDVSPNKQKLQALVQQSMEIKNTPELSPAMSICTPGIEAVSSPYATVFDNIGYEELSTSSSPSVSPWEPAFDDSFNSSSSSQPLETFDFDFDGQDSGHAHLWQQQDFQLFPDEPTSERTVFRHAAPIVASVTVSPHEAIFDSPMMELKQSPVELKLGENFMIADGPTMNVVSPAVTYNDPTTSKMVAVPGTRIAPRKPTQGNNASPNKRRFHPFAAAKIAGTDVQAPSVRVAPRKTTQSPTKVGFQPAKRVRRRRITSEEASRIVPEGHENDPHIKARYKCSQCDKTFTRPFNLRSHRATHEGLRPHECTFVDTKGAKCHWTFARRHDLERHMRSRHSPEKMFTCRTCGAQCGRSDAFKRHLARTAACNEGAEHDDEYDEDEDQDLDQVSHL